MRTTDQRKHLLNVRESCLFTSNLEEAFVCLKNSKEKRESLRSRDGEGMEKCCLFQAGASK